MSEAIRTSSVSCERRARSPVRRPTRCRPWPPGGTQKTIHRNVRLDKLFGPAQRREGLEQLVHLQRYVRQPDTDSRHRAGTIRFGKVLRLKLPVGPPVVIVFDKEQDGQGRSRFIVFRGDGVMLPRPAGEAWRMKPEDIVDLDGDGAAELLIDITMRDNRVKLGGLRIVSLRRMHEPDWVVLHPHRDEPGAFAWRLSEPVFNSKKRKIEVGPLGEGGAPPWVSWAIAYDTDWLVEHAVDAGGVFSGEMPTLPCFLVRDAPKGDAMLSAAEYLAKRLYPGRY